MTAGRELVAYRVAGTKAAPIPVSAGRVAPKAAKRLGYVAAGICKHCTDTVVRVVREDPWTHRDTGIESCLYDRIRTGISLTAVRGAVGLP